ncbi:eukaryotic translation initiation factor 2 subunit alpha [Artemisia annua]|uniref:Eukaryotic translation initiation factor 2 subunit alpha n=1 Tax=Artemisia annua TaxID=35608 RepID=A0A2U1Q331_ARTAN|nr:eukaryotic translation initiation factor 2 subunit alpha [Artemisia annua]
MQDFVLKYQNDNFPNTIPWGEERRIMFSRVGFWIWVLVQIYMIGFDVFCQYGFLISTFSARLLVSEREDKLLAEQMYKLGRQNTEVGGDEDSEVEEDMGMGSVDLDSQASSTTD